MGRRIGRHDERKEGSGSERWELPTDVAGDAQRVIALRCFRQMDPKDVVSCGLRPRHSFGDDCVPRRTKTRPTISVSSSWSYGVIDTIQETEPFERIECRSPGNLTGIQCPHTAVPQLC